MAYQTATTQNLEALADELEKIYFNNDPKYISYIVFFKQFTATISILSAQKKNKLLTAFGILGLELIINEYYIWPVRHELYLPLNAKLNITEENPLGDEERLYFLNKLLQYISENISEEVIIELKKKINACIWQEKKALQEHVHQTLKQVKLRDSNRINQLVYATPDLEGLRKNMQELPQLYAKAIEELKRWSWIQNTDRDELVCLIKLVDKACYHLYPMTEEDKIKRLQEDECEVRKGLITFVLLKIYRKYKLFSPKGGWFNHGSELFKKCLQAINATDLCDLKHEWKIAWLKALSDHIDDLKKDANFFDNMKLFWKKEQQGTNHSLEYELQDFQKAIGRYKEMQEEEKNNPSLKSWLVATGANYASQYSIMVGLGAVLKQGTQAFAANLSGPAGIALFLIMSGVSSKTGKYIYGWMIEKISTRIGDKAAEIVEKEIVFTKEGFEKLWNQLTAKEKIIFQRWVNTLLTLPSDIVADYEKRHIRNVLGLNPEDKFKRAPKLMAELDDTPKVGLFFSEKKELMVIQDYVPEQQLIADISTSVLSNR